MPNSFVTLPRPTGNGSGAAVDVSTLGALKTITVGSAGGVYEPIITVELSNDGGTSFSPVASFAGPGTTAVAVAAGKMRMTVARFVDGVVPSVEIGAPTDAVDLATLNVPIGNGHGTQLDASALGTFKTVQVAGPFGGALNLDISEDGGTSWATKFTFIAGAPAVQSAVVTADMMRVTRVGVPVVSPGLPVVAMASASSSGGGGGGGAAQAFVYTATGAETASFAVNLPAPQPSTSYIAQAVDLGRMDGTLSTFTCPQANYGLNSIRVNASQAPAAGDKIGIIITTVT